MAGRDHRMRVLVRRLYCSLGGVAADGVAEQRGHGKGRALRCCPLSPCGAECGAAFIHPRGWRGPVALDPSKQRQETAREATRKASAENPRAGPGRARQGQAVAVGVGVRRCRKWGHWRGGVLSSVLPPLRHVWRCAAP